MLTATLFLGGFSLMVSVPTFAQGRYANRYSKRDVSGIISRMETSSNAFRRDFDRAMDNSNLNGTAQEDRFNNIVADFENSVDRLRREFDRNATWWESRGQVENMIREARPVNSMMTSLAFRRNIERQWNTLRNDINTVADTFDLPGLNGGGWSGGGGNGGGGGGWDGGQTSTPPNWARGTFYSMYPAVTMTIDGNGRVTSVIGDQTFTGRFYRGSIYANGETATLTRTQTGFRTYNTSTGQTIDFSTGGSGGGGNGGGWDGPTTRPPDWASGTFYSDYSNIQLTIGRDGRVTSIVNGQTYYGRYHSGMIYSNDGQVASVKPVSGGFQTYNRNNGQTLIFRRR